jgi:D-glycero-alpha-D-manno-heptose-7-phosphate kinase
VTGFGEQPIFLGEILENYSIESSAPCRIDCGGTLDIKALALTMRGFQPTTVNFAIDLRTYVRLAPYQPDLIKVSSSGFTEEEYRFDEVPLNTPLGYFFAIVSFFNVHGVHIIIHSESPVKSALGGSSAAGVAVINALSKALEKKAQIRLTKKELLYLAYHLEDAIGVSFCGMQDHAAACYGGVNKWIWSYHPAERPYQRQALFKQKDHRRISRHLLLAYSGESHNSVEINLRWVNAFLGGRDKHQWLKLIGYVNDFACALLNQDWDAAVNALNKEMEIRLTLTPEAMIPITEELLRTAHDAKCAARFAGAGGGGCFWAIGNAPNIQNLIPRWRQILDNSPDGRLLSNKIASQGVI